jgi:hypothetical protein
MILFRGDIDRNSTFVNKKPKVGVILKLSKDSSDQEIFYHGPL